MSSRTFRQGKARCEQSPWDKSARKGKLGTRRSRVRLLWAEKSRACKDQVRACRLMDKSGRSCKVFEPSFRLLDSSYLEYIETRLPCCYWDKSCLRGTVSL